jgi:hypothetical protein
MGEVRVYNCDRCNKQIPLGEGSLNLKVTPRKSLGKYGERDLDLCLGCSQHFLAYMGMAPRDEGSSLEQTQSRPGLVRGQNVGPMEQVAKRDDS